MKPTRYSPVMRHSIITLYSQGLSMQKIADLCGITRRTLHVWVNKYGLKKEMDAAREESAKECIEVGLRKLAAGAKEEIEEEKFIYNRRAKKLVTREDGEIVEEEYVQPVEKTLRRKVKPPESKAIEVLARKYYKDFDPKTEEREFTSKLLEGFTMRELQEARKNNPIDKGKYIEAEFTSSDEDKDED